MWVHVTQNTLDSIKNCVVVFRHFLRLPVCRRILLICVSLNNTPSSRLHPQKHTAQKHSSETHCSETHCSETHCSETLLRNTLLRNRLLRNTLRNTFLRNTPQKHTPQKQPQKHPHCKQRSVLLCKTRRTRRTRSYRLLWVSTKTRKCSWSEYKRPQKKRCSSYGLNGLKLIQGLCVCVCGWARVCRVCVFVYMYLCKCVWCLGGNKGSCCWKVMCLWPTVLTTPLIWIQLRYLHKGQRQIPCTCSFRDAVCMCVCVCVCVCERECLWCVCEARVCVLLAS